MARMNKRAMAKIMPTISTPATKTTEGNIGKSRQGLHIPQQVQDLNVTWKPFNGAFITYDSSLRKFKYVAWTGWWEINTASNIGTWHWLYDSKLWADLRFRSLLAWTWIVIVQVWDDIEVRVSWVSSCSDVISCVENASNITLQNLEVIWNTLLNNLSFSAWAVIDYTNSTSTWTQSFDSSYVANYNWSTINYTNVNINNTWVNISYDNTSTVNLPTNTYVNWQQVATQADVAWLSNWKQTVRVATTNAADVTAYTYVPGNEPTWLVWTWVSSAPTIDWNTLNDWDRILIKDAWDARGNGIFVYDASQSAFIRSSDADNAPNTGEVASMMVWIHDWNINYGKIFREIHTAPITLWTDTIDMTPFIISVVAWETNTSSNEWTWVGLAMAKVWVNLPFKSLVAGTNITITDNGNEIIIASIWGWVTDCAAVISCVENATTWDLTNVDVTLWDVLNVGNTTYSNTSTIDYTNSTTTGEQNFDSSYIANYNWSTINNTNVTENNAWGTVNNTNQTINNDGDTEINNNWSTINNDNTTENNTNVTENYDNTSVTNNNGNTINNNNTTTNNTNWAVTNYDSTTEVNMEWDTNIENLTVNNITTQSWGNVVVNWAWERYDENTVWATEIVFNNTPISWEASIFVFKQDSWLHRTATDDYTYDSVNNKITFPALVSWDKIEARIMIWDSAAAQWWHTIQDDWSDMTQRAKLNFKWFNVSDDTVNDATVIEMDPSALLSWSSQTLFVSEPLATTPWWSVEFTHNLNVTQTDVEAWRYSILFTWIYNTLTFVSNTANPSVEDNWIYHYWDAADTTWASRMHWQANTVKVGLNSTNENLRIAIIDNRATGVWYEQITNNAGYDIFDSSLNWLTTVVINDSRITEDTPFNVYFESEPTGNITKEAHNWNITIVSDDASDTMAFRVVAFNMWADTYITSDVHTLDWAWPRTIVDWNITVDTPVNLFPIGTPAGYLTVEAEAGQITITSTATETSLDVKYIAFTSLSAGSILDWAYW